MKTCINRAALSHLGGFLGSAERRACPRCAWLSGTVKSTHMPASSSRSFSQALRRDQAKVGSAPAAKESILPQTHYDYFTQTLGADAIPPSGPFGIDIRALRKEFLQLQAKAHPDLAPADRKRQAEALSARINEAYKTLQNPLLRAQYLLSLRGIDVAEDETAKVDDPELLMEVLETRETIEEAQEESDLDPLKETNDTRIQASVEVLDQAFKDDDMDKAKEEAVKLRYWVNIKESIDGWEKGKPVVLIH
ncbi:Fe-S protein assembly co-chaperone HscB [Myriangium duriaei CBS 260.36]|uniref:Fe-S protein assembly co-chaperone HscB n=1 Tax=Myriangium duriaei CBS 260.36 TaxID=1168546 RepID=A0A9P4ISH1_9PEZI|nr:Fe-S protein assembly co-chaperone HscB [Myriangium duriaei CBS 260.36]